MHKHWRWAVLAAATMSMGLSMPSCGGSQALQQQVDALQTSNMDLNKKVLSLESQMRAANSDLAQMKQLLGQMTNAIQAQKAALDQIDGSVRELAARKAAPAPAPKAAAKKPAGKTPPKRRH